MTLRTTLRILCAAPLALVLSCAASLDSAKGDTTAKPAPAPSTPAAHHASADDVRPYSETADAMADADAAIARAQANGTNALLVLGGNWCHDSRGLAWKFGEPELADLIADNYELVYIDVGHRDRNLKVAERFGVTRLRGTPTVLIVDGDGALLNADSVHDWSTAASRSMDETTAYFSRWRRDE